MMMKKSTLLTAIVVCTTLSAQEFREKTDSTEKVLDTLTAHTKPLEGYHMNYNVFKKGNGAVIDTIDVGDARLRILLRDDNTWCYIKNFDLFSQDSLFIDHWDTEKAHPFKDVPLTALAYRNTIILDDGISTFCPPYVNIVRSRFGYRHGRRHQGTDIPLKKGDSVKAAFDGCVRFSARCGGYGNLVVIRHINGLETYYGHLSKLLVKPGQWVRAGEEIGLGGSTGHSTGPHLHFETRFRGYAFDPEWIIDFPNGKLRRNVFVLRRSYLDASSRYAQNLEDEEDIYKTDEQIAAEEERIAKERAAIRWHKVKSGETLSGIAKRNGKTLNQIKKLNPGINPSRLRIGQKIRVN